MAERKKIFAICGSTRSRSTNLNLLQAIAVLYNDKIALEIFENIILLPHFNPDHTDAAIPEVENLRQHIRHAAGVIICTPEYAHGVSGSLKNAIDWSISTNEFSFKPTALITAATDGSFAHASLLETLKTIEAANVQQLQLLIPFAKTKIGVHNIITDEKTLTAIKKLIDDLLKTIEETAASTL